MKAIGEAAGGSVNDVLLAACSGDACVANPSWDTRRAAAATSLIRLDPVALRADAEQAGGNAISFANVRLGTGRRGRARAFRRSSRAAVRRVRAYLRQMSATALIDYTVLIRLAAECSHRVACRHRCARCRRSTTSSSPTSPVRAQAVLLGAEMEAYYPISALAHGQALNITVMSYAGGCTSASRPATNRVPSMQRLAVLHGRGTRGAGGGVPRRRAPGSSRAEERTQESGHLGREACGGRRPDPRPRRPSRRRAAAARRA